MPVSLPPLDQAIAAHGCIVYVNLDENGDVQEEFVPITGLNSDVPQPFQRTFTETTPHDRDIDEGVIGVNRRGDIALTLNYRQQQPVHKGLRLAQFKGTYFGFMFVGIEGRIADDGTDTVLASGYCLTFNEGNPVRDGARSAACTLRPSGNYWADGVLYGPRDFS